MHECKRLHPWYWSAHDFKSCCAHVICSMRGREVAELNISRYEMHVQRHQHVAVHCYYWSDTYAWGTPHQSWRWSAPVLRSKVWRARRRSSHSMFQSLCLWRQPVEHKQRMWEKHPKQNKTKHLCTIWKMHAQCEGPNPWNKSGQRDRSLLEKAQTVLHVPCAGFPLLVIMWCRCESTWMMYSFPA